MLLPSRFSFHKQQFWKEDMSSLRAEVACCRVLAALMVAACASPVALAQKKAAAPVAEPLCRAEQEEHASEGKTHHGDDQGQPSCARVRPVLANAAKGKPGEQGADHADRDRPDAPAEQLRSSVVRHRSAPARCQLFRPCWFSLNHRGHCSFLDQMQNLAVERQHDAHHDAGH